MAIYDLAKLVKETRRLCVEWHAQGKTTGMTGEIAAYAAARALDLDLVDDKSKGYTAIGKGARAGLRILIKGRALFKDQKSRQRLGAMNLDQEWDLLLLVLLDSQFEPLEIYEAKRSEILASLEPTDAENRKGPMSVAKFKAIGILVWDSRDGLKAKENCDNKK